MIVSTFFDHLLSASQETKLSVKAIAQQCVTAGITGLDILDCHLTSEKRYLLEECRSCGMTVSSFVSFSDFAHDPSASRAEQILKQAISIGAPIILAVPGYLNEGENRQAAMEKTLSALDMLCSRAKRYGITVGVEDFDDRRVPVTDTAELKWYLDRIPTLSCILDTGNFLYCGEDTLTAYESLKSRITRQIHCKDRTFRFCPGADPLQTTDGKTVYGTAVGEGEVPIGSVLTDAFLNGFDGTVTIEIFGISDQLGGLLRSAEYITERKRHTIHAE